MNKKLFALGAVSLGIIGYLSTVAFVDKSDQQLAMSKLSTYSQLSETSLDYRAMKVLSDNGCSYCHTPNSPMPFYANFPVAKSLMEHDVAQGLRHFQLKPVLEQVHAQEQVSEVALAKIEGVLQDGSMPPKAYLSMHWRSDLSEEERQILLGWVAEKRLQRHANSPASVEFKREPVQPIYTQFDVDKDKVALGKALYHDTRLSGDNTLSCASCHRLEAGGVDHLTTSSGIKGAKGPINAPTVYNAVYNSLQFWDGRAHNLQEQAGGPPLNPIEMGSQDWREIIAKLSDDSMLKAQFDKVYGGLVNQATITGAISEFEKTLTTPNSRFDQYLKGDKHALTEQELEGYQLFKQYKCDTCHVGEAMGGEGFEVMGLKADYFADRGQVTEVDMGRYNVTRVENDKHRFKVPTLRNVALTAPYFHDGQAETLEKAVFDMAKYQVGVELNQQETDKITAYLKTLTGEYNGKLLN